MEESLAERKARLIWHGKVRLEPRDGLPRIFSRDTAGPGAGGKALAFAFEGARVKLRVSDDPGTELLFTRDDRLSVLGKKDIARGVSVAPTLLHCPGQAFVNLTPGCSYSCAFCATPLTPDRVAAAITDDALFEAVMAASESKAFESVAVTSGVGGSVGATLGRMARFVERARRALPEAPIGVEPYIEDPRWVGALHDAGATEIKLNLEAATTRLFEMLCPDRDWDDIVASLERAVEVFGRGKVTSNIIFGFGETDGEVIGQYRTLADTGVVPNLRALRVTDANRQRLKDALGFEPSTPEPMRILSLAREARKVLEERGLTTLTFKTMCFPCQCCDVVPFRDV